MPGTEYEQIVLAGADDHDLTKLSEYEKVGGYQSLRKALGMERQAVLDELASSRCTRRMRTRRSPFAVASSTNPLRASGSSYYDIW